MLTRKCPEGDCFCEECPGITEQQIGAYLESLGFISKRSRSWQSPPELFGHEFSVVQKSDGEDLRYSSNLLCEDMLLPAPYETPEAAIQGLVASACHKANMRVESAVKTKKHITALYHALTLKTTP